MLTYTFTPTANRHVIDDLLRKVQHERVDKEDIFPLLSEMFQTVEKLEIDMNKTKILESANKFFAMTFSSSQGNKLVVLYGSDIKTGYEALMKLCELYNINVELFSNTSTFKLDYVDGKSFFLIDFPVSNSRDRIFAT